ncbi:MAG: hypothetical protein AB7N76_06615 [Planctomycetota bacterium]
MDFQETLRAQAEAEERPALQAAARAALAAAPGPEALRELSRVAAGLGTLEPAQAEQALAHVRAGLASKDPDARWDAAHVAAELLLPAGKQAAALAKLLWDVAEDARQAGAVRARALEGWAELAPAEEVTERLEVMRTKDESWTVRRAAKDAARRRAKEESLRGALYGRFEALLRTERLRFEADDEGIDAAKLAKLGLRLPAAYQLFLLQCFAGGRLVFLEPATKGDPQDGEHFSLTPPARLVAAARAPSDLANFNEYVYTRYVDGEGRYAKVDEDYALKRYGEFYARPWVDDEAYNYGVLLFEAAYRDEQRRAEHLLRCRDVLRAYRARSGEEWDVVDDRLEEVEGTLTDEGLAWPAADRPRQPIVIGAWGGVTELALDLEGPGVFARDPDAPKGEEWWRVAPCVSAFLNGPGIARPGASEGSDPLSLLQRAGAAIDAGNKRQAARLFADALEQDRKGKAVLDAAAALLSRADLSPLSAGQLCAAILLEGDKTSAESVRAALQATEPERAQAMVEALAPYDEDGSQVALFVDAASGLRKRTHSGVKEAAKLAREGRGKQHIRTLRNPWHK